MSSLKPLTFKHTRISCNVGSFAQGLSMNLTPFLFVPLKSLYGISYTELGFLVLVNFIAQFVADMNFGYLVNKYGYRLFCILSQLAITIGLVLFALAPWIAPNAIYPLLVVSTIIFSSAIGLNEVILAPVINTIPTQKKGSNLSFMHACFAGGIFSAALFTTLFLYFFGNEMWFVIVILWSLIPLFNSLLFIKVPLPEITPESKRMKLGSLLRHPVFIISFFAIFFGGATELLIVQWGSSYLEKGIGLAKTVGDVGGLCSLAAMLLVGRIIFAKAGNKLNLNNLMIGGSLACIICYVILAATPYTWLVFLAFALIGLFSCMLWTGTLLVASNHLPYTGVIIYALLAGGGDLGTAITGQLVGWLSDFFALRLPTGLALTAEQYGLRMAIAIAIIVPILSMIFQMILKKLAPYKK